MKKPVKKVATPRKRVAKKVVARDEASLLRAQITDLKNDVQTLYSMQKGFRNVTESAISGIRNGVNRLNERAFVSPPLQAEYNELIKTVAHMRAIADRILAVEARLDNHDILLAPKKSPTE